MEEQGFSLETRGEIRKLAQTSWDKELTHELELLAMAFEALKRGETTPGEVAEVVHEFDEVVYRKLMEIKQTHEPALLIGRAIVKGYLTDLDVPEEARPLVKRAILFYRSKTRVFDRRQTPPPEEA